MSKSLIIYGKIMKKNQEPWLAKVEIFGDSENALDVRTRVFDGDVAEALDAAGFFLPQGYTVLNTIPIPE